MSNLTNGGPAFPSIEYSQNEGHWEGRYPINTQHGGMTLRDWFAGQIAGEYFDADVIDPAKAAKFVYQCADAMIAEREKARGEVSGMVTHE